MRLYCLCSLLFVLASGVLFSSSSRCAAAAIHSSAGVAVLVLHDPAHAFDVPPRDEVAEVADVEERGAGGVVATDELNGTDGEVTREAGAEVARASHHSALDVSTIAARARPGHARSREHPPRA